MKANSWLIVKQKTAICLVVAPVTDHYGTVTSRKISAFDLKILPVWGKRARGSVARSCSNNDHTGPHNCDQI
ncbi:MAG: hypothetical protein ACKVG0_05510, partial [Alphaproteobacteria bacterium]